MLSCYDAKRKTRISQSKENRRNAKGINVDIAEVNRFIKRQSRKMMAE